MNGGNMKRSKGKGINARAWFYSQSFVSSALGLPEPEPSEEVKKTVAALKESLAKLESDEKSVQK